MAYDSVSVPRNKPVSEKKRKKKKENVLANSVEMFSLLTFISKHLCHSDPGIKPSQPRELPIVPYNNTLSIEHGN